MEAERRITDSIADTDAMNVLTSEDAGLYAVSILAADTSSIRSGGLAVLRSVNIS